MDIKKHQLKLNALYVARKIKRTSTRKYNKKRWKHLLSYTNYVKFDLWRASTMSYSAIADKVLIESYLPVNFPQSRSALLLVLSEQMNQYFCSSTMKKTVFVTHINTRIHCDVLSVCCRSRMECCEMLWSGLWPSCFQSPCLPYYPGELLPIMDCTAGEAPTETFFGFRSIE